MRLEEAGEVGAGPELGDLQVERTEARIEAAVAVAIAPGRAVTGALVPPRADHAVDIGFHDQLQHALGDAAQENAISGLRHQLGKR